MAVAVSEVARQDQSPSLPETTPSAISLPSASPSLHHESKPTEPLEVSAPPPEPIYGSVTAKEWEVWVGQKEAHVIYTQKRDRARAYAAENDLRGTF